MSQIGRGGRQVRSVSELSENSSGYGSIRSFEEERRQHHNLSERQRRAAENAAFQELRELVPSIRNNRKASRIDIMLHAAEYITELKERRKLRDAEAEKKRIAEEGILKT